MVQLTFESLAQNSVHELKICYILVAQRHIVYPTGTILTNRSYAYVTQPCIGKSTTNALRSTNSKSTQTFPRFTINSISAPSFTYCRLCRMAYPIYQNLLMYHILLLSIYLVVPFFNSFPPANSIYNRNRSSSSSYALIELL